MADHGACDSRTPNNSASPLAWRGRKPMASAVPTIPILTRCGGATVKSAESPTSAPGTTASPQLLDYASALWRLTVEDFERVVLRRHLGDCDARGMAEFVLEELHGGQEDPGEATERTLEGLGSSRPRRSRAACSASSSTSTPAALPCSGWR